MNMENKQNEELEEIKWGGILNEFLWTCAGANKKILRQCPTDYAKYAGIGGTILFTALMAMLSGGYALYTVFDNQIVAILFGVFWGLLIFNLDRFIVNTMYSDGKVTISWSEFSSGLPRIIMAIFLGIVISTPLELKIFEDEINITIEELKEAKLNSYQAELKKEIDSLSYKREEVSNSTYSPYDGELHTGNVEIDNLLNSIKEKRIDIKLQKEKLNSFNLSNCQNQADSIKTKNAIYAIKKQIGMLNTQLSSLEGELGAKDSYYKSLNTEKRNRQRKEEERLEKEISLKDSILQEGQRAFEEKLKKEFGGFQAHMLAFNQMKDEHSSTNITSLFIMLLFIIIETAPTFFKMMIASGPYDDLLRSEMHKARVLSDKRISDINDEINTEIMISTEKNKNKLEAEVAANKELLNKIAQAQAELLATAIEEWRKSELKKIEENPSAYIKTNPPTNKK